VRLSEQSGFGLDEDAPVGQAFELGADVLGVLGHDRQVQGQAQVAGPQGTAELGERGKDLLVGGPAGYRRRRSGRLCGGLAVVVPGEGDQGLAVMIIALAIAVSARSPRAFPLRQAYRRWGR